MTAYYNEIDPYAAQWLRNLIAAGHIAPGDVDERSIEDVKPDEIRGYTQCHFFAGVGIWSLGLRTEGWPDDRPVWTGSCPCQPFSAAGKGDGFDDERHLWPAWHHLIRECRPNEVFGEQVAGKDGLAWFDLVQSDLEADGYATGAVITAAAGFGAPHIRPRQYFAAYDLRLAASRLGHAIRSGPQRHTGDGNPGHEPRRNGAEANRSASPASVSDRMADAAGQRWQGAANRRNNEGGACSSPDSPEGTNGLADANSVDGRLSAGQDWHKVPENIGGGEACRVADTRSIGRDQSRNRDHRGDDRHVIDPGSENDRPGPTNGLWADADWLFCRDGKWRPIRPGSFPLAHGVANRVGQLRAYGNGLCLAQVSEFVAAYLDRHTVDLRKAVAGDLFEHFT